MYNHILNLLAKQEIESAKKEDKPPEAASRRRRATDEKSVPPSGNENQVPAKTDSPETVTKKTELSVSEATAKGDVSVLYCKNSKDLDIRKVTVIIVKFE